MGHYLWNLKYTRLTIYFIRTYVGLPKLFEKQTNITIWVGWTKRITFFPTEYTRYINIVNAYYFLKVNRFADCIQ